MAGQLSRKRILITGVAQGIGLECVRAYVREGARVVILDVSAEALANASRDFGASALTIECDVADGPSLERAIATAVANLGGLDCVHNNASISTPSTPLHLTEEEEWDRIFRVNLKSVFWMSKHSYAHLKKVPRVHPEHCKHGRCYRTVGSRRLCSNEGRDDLTHEGYGT
jgi:meso-butanediol dehydrogenase/(S,S)-butanediol dehydrogenase/diacetyl reductase